MANTFLAKRSSVSTTVPAAGTLTPGELAINTADGKLFTKRTNNVVYELGAGQSTYQTLLRASASHTAAKVLGTYALGRGDPTAVSGTGTLYPVELIQIDSTDFQTITGLAIKLRIRATLSVNDVAPTGNFTFGLYPVTRPATSGGAGLDIYTLGTVITGSNGATFTAPAADSMLTFYGGRFCPSS